MLIKFSKLFDDEHSKFHISDSEDAFSQKVLELKKVQKDHDSLEVAIDKLRIQLSAIDLSKKELQHQVFN